MAIDIYHVETTEDELAEEFATAVRYGTIGILIQCIVSSVFAMLQNTIHKFIGVTDHYHVCAAIFAISSMCVKYVTSFPESLIIMVVQGITLPVVFSTPYVLIEVHTEDEDTPEEEHEEQHKALDIHLKKPPQHARRASIDQTPLKDVEISNTIKKPERFTVSVLEEWRGVLTACMNVTMIISQILVGSLTGILIDWYGQINIVFTLTGTLLFIVNITMVFFSGTKPTKVAKEEELSEISGRPVVSVKDYGSTWNVLAAMKRASAQQKGHHPLHRTQSAPSLFTPLRHARTPRKNAPVYAGRQVRQLTWGEQAYLERMRERNRLFGLPTLDGDPRRPLHHLSTGHRYDSTTNLNDSPAHSTHFSYDVPPSASLESTSAVPPQWNHARALSLMNPSTCATHEEKALLLPITYIPDIPQTFPESTLRPSLSTPSLHTPANNTPPSTETIPEDEDGDRP
jgi:hypothetical protein